MKLVKPAHARPEHTIALRLSKCRRGFALVAVLVVAALVIGIGATLGYQKLKTKPSPSPTPAIDQTKKDLSSDLSSETSVKEETANWKTFQGKYGFSFKIPTSAKVSEGQDIGNYLNGLKSIGVRVENNQEAGGNHSQDYFDNRFDLNITTSNSKPDELVSQFLANLDKNQQPSPYQNANTQIKNKAQRTLRDYKNGEISGKYLRVGYEYDYAVILSSGNGKTYIFSYTGDNGQISDKTGQLLEQILSTFRFLD